MVLAVPEPVVPHDSPPGEPGNLACSLRGSSTPPLRANLDTSAPGGTRQAVPMNGHSVTPPSDGAPPGRRSDDRELPTVHPVRSPRLLPRLNNGEGQVRDGDAGPSMTLVPRGVGAQPSLRPTNVAESRHARAQTAENPLQHAPKDRWAGAGTSSPRGTCRTPRRSYDRGVRSGNQPSPAVPSSGKPHSSSRQPRVAVAQIDPS